MGWEVNQFRLGRGWGSEWDVRNVRNVLNRPALWARIQHVRSVRNVVTLPNTLSVVNLLITGPCGPDIAHTLDMSNISNLPPVRIIHNARRRWTLTIRTHRIWPGFDMLNVFELFWMLRPPRPHLAGIDMFEMCNML